MSWFKSEPDWQEKANQYEAKIKCECGAYFSPDEHGCYSCGRLSGSKEVVMVREVWKYDAKQSPFTQLLKRKFLRWEEGPQ